MNQLGLFAVAIGAIYLVYSVLSKNKVTIYNRGRRMKVIEMENFLRLQLTFSVINSLCMTALGVIVIIYKLSDIYVIASPLLFHFINYLFRAVSKRKGYITYI